MVGATERDEEARGAFRERPRSVDPERLLFVDESSTNVAFTPGLRQSAQGREGSREGA
jgi:hypothetical protein